MNQTENPLDKLRDIHLPEQLDQFQLAPGWWFLITIFIMLIIFAIYRWYKKRRSLYLLNPANQELKEIAQLPPNTQAIAKLSALLKRVCLVYFPKHQVSALSGNNWINFLNQQCSEKLNNKNSDNKNVLFNQEQQQVFSETMYQANSEIDNQLWQALINNSQIAIDHIIRSNAREYK